MNSFVQALCLFCAVTSSAPQPQMPQGEGDIWFTHEKMSRSTHLLRLSTTDFILDADLVRHGRLQAFAHRFARQTCQGDYELAIAARDSWPDTRPLYARQYTFRCR